MLRNVALVMTDKWPKGLFNLPSAILFQIRISTFDELCRQIERFSRNSNPDLNSTANMENIFAMEIKSGFKFGLLILAQVTINLSDVYHRSSSRDESFTQ